MKILIIGASGTIGKHLFAEFSKRHEVLTASRNGAQIEVDITSAASIRRMYETAGEIDAVVCSAGPAKFGALAGLSEDDFYIGIRGKLMGQVNLARIGQEFIRNGGSITLTTGILADEPVRGSAALSMVNGGINSFVAAAAGEMPRGIRINAVCPTVVEDSVETYASIFAGFDPVSMKRVVNGYVRSAEGNSTGRVFRIY